MSEGFQELLLQTVEVHIRCLAPGDDIHINSRQATTSAPECFPDIPFNPVTGHRTTNFFAYGDPKTGIRMGIGLPHHKYSPGSILLYGTCQIEKFRALAKPDNRWKGGIGNHDSQAVSELFRCNADGKVFSSLCPSALDNEAAILAGHPHEEAMGPFA